MIERTAKDALLRLASQFAVIGITGPRQSGKSTLAKMAFPKKRYISFDDKTIRELAAANPMDFLLAFPDGAIIDEAQKVPEIFDAVKYHVDQSSFSPGKFVLTGSNQFNLKQNMTDSLADRAAFVKLLPFSIGELKNGNLLNNNVYETIFKGFYPPLHDTTKHFTPDDWFNNYVDTYLDLDVESQINYSNLSVFKKFIQICATIVAKCSRWTALHVASAFRPRPLSNGSPSWSRRSSSTYWSLTHRTLANHWSKRRNCISSIQAYFAICCGLSRERS